MPRQIIRPGQRKCAWALVELTMRLEICQSIQIGGIPILFPLSDVLDEREARSDSAADCRLMST